MQRYLRSLALASAIGGLAGLAHARTAKVYVITEWHAGCGDSSDDRHLWDGMALSWYAGIGASSLYSFGGQAVNGDIKKNWFADPQANAETTIVPQSWVRL